MPSFHGVFSSKEKAEKYVVEELEVIERNVDWVDNKHTIDDYIKAFKVIEMEVL